MKNLKLFLMNTSIYKMLLAIICITTLVLALSIWSYSEKQKSNILPAFASTDSVYSEPGEPFEVAYTYSDELTGLELLIASASELDEEEQNALQESADVSNTDIVSSSSAKYYIKVNYGAQVATVYTKDSDGNYTVPIKAMICSTGTATPTSGIYTTSNVKYAWHTLFGNVYGQYTTQIVGNILFHSVPYSEKYNHGSLISSYYDKLGTYASAGCVRLTVADSKWIYDNCSSGTFVEFYTSSTPGPLGKPTATKVSDAEGDLKYWDPTDTNSENPWLTYSPSTEETTTDETTPEVDVETNTDQETTPDTTLDDSADTDVDTDVETNLDTDGETDLDTDDEQLNTNQDDTLLEE